jgi:hypothetical protein
VDAIAHYWGAIALAEYPELEWCRHPNPPGIPVHVANYPVVMVPARPTGFCMDPIGTVYRAAAWASEHAAAPFGRVHASCEPEALREIYELNVRYIEQGRGTPDPIDLPQ